MALPAYTALPPASCFPMNSAVGSAYDLESSFASLAPVEITAGTPAFFSACSKTAPPPTGGELMLDDSSSTANGFSAATSTASARCAASSLPLDFTNVNSTVRPHVSYACL